LLNRKKKKEVSAEAKPFSHKAVVIGYVISKQCDNPFFLSQPNCSLGEQTTPNPLPECWQSKVVFTP